MPKVRCDMNKVKLYEILISGQSTNCFIFEITNKNGSKYFCFQNNRSFITVLKIKSIGEFLGIIKSKFSLSLRPLEGLEVDTYADMFYEAVGSNKSNAANRLFEYLTKMYKKNSNHSLDLNNINILDDEENKVSENVTTLSREDEKYIEFNKPRNY